MKYLLLTAMLITAPLAASAQQLSDSQRDVVCTGLGKLTGVTAKYRDEGQTASSAYTVLVSNGLNDQVALGIIRIVYDEMPDASPETVAGISYIACLEATKQ